MEAALHEEENKRIKGVHAKLPPGSFTSLKGTAASKLFTSHTQVCLMLAKGSGGGKGEAALVVEEERIKAVHAKHPPEHAKARQELSPPLSPSLDSASFYSSRYAHTTTLAGRLCSPATEVRATQAPKHAAAHTAAHRELSLAVPLRIQAALPPPANERKTCRCQSMLLCFMKILAVL